MTQTQPANQTNDKVSLFQAGPLAAWREHTTPHPKMGEIQGKVFLKEKLGLTGTEMSLGQLEPGEGIPFIHIHKQNEETYIFLTGRGEMLLDGETYPVEAGSVVRVATTVERSWRNTGEEPLNYIVIQARTDSLEQWTGGDGQI